MFSILPGEAGQSFSCQGAKVCPISKGACPGPCIFADVMESVNLGVIVFNLEHGALMFCNTWAKDLIRRNGMSVDFATLTSWFLPPKEQLFSKPVHEPVVKQLGTRFLGYTVYHNGSFSWIFVRDVTEKMRLEAVAEAVETTNNLGYVFSAVRHELGNPVNAVKIALSVLRANLSHFPPEKVAQYLDEIIHEMGQVEHLLRSLKSFSLYEGLDAKPTDGAQLLRSFESLMAPELARRGVAFQVEAAGNCRLLCDPRALQQALLNLVTNAADALQGQIAPEIRITQSCGEGVTTIRIKDNGPGIPEDQQAHLFRPFFTSKANGTGLGLVITRKLLARMSGTIQLVSNNSGTEATITLPRAQPS